MLLIPVKPIRSSNKNVITIDALVIIKSIVLEEFTSSTQVIFLTFQNDVGPIISCLTCSAMVPMASMEEHCMSLHSNEPQVQHVSWEGKHIGWQHCPLDE